MSSCPPRGEEGFTLVEVLVSLLIFMVASLGLLPLLITSLQANQDHHHLAQARRLAGEVMTRLQTAGYDTLPATIDAPLGSGPIEILQEVEPDRPAAGQTRLTVTACWEMRGRQHQYRLQSVRSAP